MCRAGFVKAAIFHSLTGDVACKHYWKSSQSVHVQRPRHNSEWRVLASRKRHRVLGRRSLQFQRNILTPCSEVNPVSNGSMFLLDLVNHEAQ